MMAIGPAFFAAITVLDDKPSEKKLPKKTGRVFKAPKIKTVTPVDGRCAFFDAIAAVVEVVGATATAADVAAIGATTIGSIAGPALAGAALGSVGGAIAGDPLKGAEIGGLVGLAGGAADAAGVFGGVEGGGGAIAGGAGSDAVAAGAPGAAGAVPAAAAAPAGASAAGLAGAGAVPGSLAADASGVVGITPDLTAPTIAGAGDISSFTPSAADISGAIAPSSSTGILGTGITGKDIGTGVSALSLGNTLLSGQQQPTALKNLGNLANSQLGQSQQLESYLQSGKLPPGVQNTINLAEKNAEATIRSKYASYGQSGSTAEAQDVANAKLIAANEGTQLAEQLLQQGVSEANLSGELFAQIMQLQNQQNAQVGSAISNFAGAIGGRSPIVINTGNSSGNG